MYSLLIDTHDKDVLIVLYKDGKVLDKVNKESNMRHSEITMPSLVELINKNGITINDINEIFVVIGPGSFTGVRIGVVIAKTLAYLLKKTIRCMTSIDLLFFSNGLRNGLYGCLEKNGCFVCEYNGDLLTNTNIKYYSKKDFESSFNDKDVLLDIDLDLEKIYEYASKLEEINPHLVNPIYVKQIEVLK